MISVQLYHDQFAKMGHDKSLHQFFPKNSAVLECKMTESEFDEFLKENDMITIRNHLKTYQDGAICGEFNVI